MLTKNWSMYFTLNNMRFLKKVTYANRKLIKGVHKLYYTHYGYQYPWAHYGNLPTYQYPYEGEHGIEYCSHCSTNMQVEMFKDNGPNPFVTNINDATKVNHNYRTALWTGNHMQLTLMSLNPGEDIGLEMHPQVDQFLRIEQGHGITQMGPEKHNLSFTAYVQYNSAIFIPAGTWHNLTNTGHIPLKLYSIYAPPNHPHGTVHPTKADAIASEY